MIIFLAQRTTKLELQQKWNVVNIKWYNKCCYSNRAKKQGFPDVECPEISGCTSRSGVWIVPNTSFYFHCYKKFGNHFRDSVRTLTLAFSGVHARRHECCGYQCAPNAGDSYGICITKCRLNLISVLLQPGKLTGAFSRWRHHARVCRLDAGAWPIALSCPFRPHRVVDVWRCVRYDERRVSPTTDSATVLQNTKKHYTNEAHMRKK